MELNYGKFGIGFSGRHESNLACFRLLFTSREQIKISFSEAQIKLVFYARPLAIRNKKVDRLSPKKPSNFVGKDFT